MFTKDPADLSPAQNIITMAISSWEGGIGLGGDLGSSFPGQASLVAQTVKNPPAMRETWVQALGWDWRRKQLPTLAFWPG